MVGDVNGVLTCEFSAYSDLFKHTEPYISSSTHTLLISRLDHRSLASYIGFDHMTIYWLTRINGTLNLQPDIQQILETIQSHKQFDLILFEGLDWLFEIYTEQEVYQFLTQISTILNESQSCFLLFQPLTLSPLQYAKVKRIAPDVKQEHLLTKTKSKKTVVNVKSKIEAPEKIQDSTLKILTTLPQLGFSHEHVSKRMLQWKRMGFDVSMLQPALSMRSLEDAYTLYVQTEQKVRDAVELIHEVQAKSSNLSSKIVQRCLYNLYQLENFDDVKKWLNSKNALL